MSTKFRENQLSWQSNNFCQDARKKHVKTFVTRAWKHGRPYTTLFVHTSREGHRRQADGERRPAKMGEKGGDGDKAFPKRFVNDRFQCESRGGACSTLTSSVPTVSPVTSFRCGSA